MTYQLEAVEPCRPSRRGRDRGRCVWLVGPHEHLPGGHSPLPEARNKYRNERSDCGFTIEGEGAFEIWTRNASSFSHSDASPTIPLASLFILTAIVAVGCLVGPPIVREVRATFLAVEATLYARTNISPIWPAGILAQAISARARATGNR